MTRLNLRCPDPIANALKAIAKRRKRSISAQLLAYIVQGLKRDKMPVEGEGQ